MVSKEYDIQEYKTKVGANIAKYRKMKNLSQKELANLIGISAQTLSCLETGINSPSFKMAVNISQALDIPFSHLCTFDDEEFTIKDKELLFLAAEAFKGLDYPKRQIAFELIKCFRRKSKKVEFN